MKFNKKILNYSAWITLVIMYVLPYQSTDGFATNFGYPIAFLTIYDVPISTSLFNSFLLDMGAFLIDMLIIYIVIYFACRLVVLIKNKKNISQ